MLFDYLLATKKQGRFPPVIVPDNTASRRIADKCGFLLEVTLRGPFSNEGREHMLLLCGLLRDDRRPWHEVT